MDDMLAGPNHDPNWNEDFESIPDNAIYISEDGDDETGDGSFDFPFHSFSRAIAAIQTSGSIVNKDYDDGYNGD